MHLQLVTNSVHIPPLADPFSTFYTFCYLGLCNYLPMLIYFLKLLPPYLRQCERTSGEILGTRTFGDLIYTGKLFDGLFCTQISPFYTYHLLKTEFVHNWFYMVYFVYLFLGGLILRLGALTSGDLLCTHSSFCWLIQYIRKFLKSYSVHILPHFWPILYKYHLFMTLFVRCEFMAYFVFLLFGVRIHLAGVFFCISGTSQRLILYTCWHTFCKYPLFMT